MVQLGLLPAPKTAHGVNAALGRYLAAAIERDGQGPTSPPPFPRLRRASPWSAGELTLPAPG